VANLCWCDGTGIPFASYRFKKSVGGGYRYDHYCACPAGQDAKRATLGAEAAAADDEREQRWQHRVTQQLAHAGVPPRFQWMSFDSYPLTARTQAVHRAIWYWSNTAYLTPDDNDGGDGLPGLLLGGPCGVGKTGLAVALLRECCLSDGPDANICFVSVPTLLDQLRRGYGRHGRDAEVDDPMEAVQAADLLVLDDFGAERATDWATERLYLLINARHSQDNAGQRTILTTNLSPAAIADQHGERIAWPLIEMCWTVTLDGPNLRDRAARAAPARDLVAQAERIAQAADR
jgi:DNA replication protein DnaC